jgi:uncharacterized integral membrane protein
MAEIGSPQRERWRGTGIYWGLIVGLILAAAVVVGVTQNSQRVEVKYLVWEGHASLAVVLLATVVVTVALTTVAGVVWRRSRRRRLTQQDELQSLRAVEPTSASDAPSTPAPVDRPKHD